MSQGSHGSGEAPGCRREKLAASTTSLRSRSSVRTTRADQTSGSSGVLAQPAASARQNPSRLDRIPRIPTSLRRVPQRAVDFGGEARERAEQCVTLEPIEHALPLALAGNQASALKHREM